MASEPSDDQAVSVQLPSDLREWLDRKATDLDLDEETVIVQLLAAYQAAEGFDDEEVDASTLLDVEHDGLEDAVRSIVADRIPDIAGAVTEHLDGQGVDDETVERLDAELDDLEREVGSLESEFQSKLEDVRERVIQVKRETDAKAPAEHTHPELDEVATLRAELEELSGALEDVRATVGDVEDDVDDLREVESRLEDAEEKLNTIAWVVSDLREAHEAQQTGTRAIDRLKQTAAEADVDRAVCDNCETPVDIALLTEPKCPHCEATVNDVRLPGGLFGKPRLSIAKQLEAGDGDDEDNSNVPDAARR